MHLLLNNRRLSYWAVSKDDDFVNNMLFVYMVIKPSFKYLKNKKIKFFLVILKQETLLYQSYFHFILY